MLFDGSDRHVLATMTVPVDSSCDGKTAHDEWQ
jgi:hypothetical protein